MRICLFFKVIGIIYLAVPILYAQPEGFHLVAGNATAPAIIDGALVIQSGRQTIIQWDGFSIDAGQIVKFQQLDACSAILNRVSGGEASRLMGSLLSNGKVYLINPNGVLIGPDARIETAGFIGASFDVLDADFLKGKELFFSGESENSVVNLGTISCPSGDVALIARKVANHGTIAAEQVQLAAGLEVLLKTEGPEKILIRPAIEKDSSIDGAALEHSGSIKALVAELKSGRSPYTKAIQCSGNICANAVSEKGGRVFLIADQGRVELSGTIQAVNENGIGGEVRVLGKEIGLLDGAKIDVSGKQGGGSVLVGGSFQGSDTSIENAQFTYAAADTEVKADALKSGNGGQIVFWSDKATAHYGKISAKGGPQGGDGGSVEVSGDWLDYRGLTDASAPLGRSGTFLLDPTDITISTGADTNATWSTCSGGTSSYTITALSNTAIINNVLLGQHLDLCNVTISTASTGSGPAGGSITVNNLISWSAANKLTLNAESYITVAAGANISNTSASSFNAMEFTASGGSLSTNLYGIHVQAAISTVNGNIQLLGTVSSAAGAGTCAGVRISGSGAVSTTGGTIAVGGSVPAIARIGIGVQLVKTNPITSATGAITVSGVSAATSAGSHGVHLSSSWAANTTGLLTFGSLIGPSISGCIGGSGTGSHGLNIASSLTTQGAITAVNLIQGGAGISSYGFINTASIVTTNGSIQITAASKGAGISASCGIYIQNSITATTDLHLLGVLNASSPNSASINWGVQIAGGLTASSGSLWIGGLVQPSAGGSYTGTSYGVSSSAGAATHLLSAANGGVKISGDASSASGVGVGVVLSRSINLTGDVIFGDTISDPTAGYSVSGCRGGGGTSSFGMRVTQPFNVTGSITAINSIQGGTGITSNGFYNSDSGSIVSSKSIQITASSRAEGAGASYGIGVGNSITANTDLKLFGVLNAANNNTGPSAGVFINRTATATTGSVSIAGSVMNTNYSTLVSGVRLNSGYSISGATGVFISADNTLSNDASSYGVFAFGNGSVTGALTFGNLISDPGATYSAVSGCKGGSGTSSHGIYINANLPVTGAVTAINSILGGTGSSSCGLYFNASVFSSGTNSDITVNASTGATGSDAYGVRLSSGSITSGKNIDITGSGGGDYGLSIDSGASLSSVGSISLTSTTTPMSLSGTERTQGGAISWNSPVDLNQNATADTTNSGTVPAGAAITIGTVDGAYGLTLNGGTGGAVSMGGAIGGTTPLLSLSVTAASTQVNADQTVASGPMTYIGPVVLGAPVAFTDNGTGAMSFSSSITGNYDLDLAASSTSISISGAVDLSGAGVAGANLTAANAGGNITVGGPITVTGAPGGDVIISTSSGSGASISVNDIDASSTNAGAGGAITLQPDNLMNIGTLGNVPAGTILFTGTMIISTSNGGAGGNIQLAPSGKTAVPSVATMFGSYLLANSLQFTGGSLSMGVNEMMTIYGDGSLTMASVANLGNIAALGNLTINAPTINAIQTSPTIASLVLASDGTFYVSPNVHFTSYQTPLIIGSVSPPDTRRVAASSLIPSQGQYRLALMYNPPGGTPLNYDDPNAISAIISAIVSKFNVANSQLSILLPLLYAQWQLPPTWASCQIGDNLKCKKHDKNCTNNIIKAKNHKNCRDVFSKTKTFLLENRLL